MIRPETIVEVAALKAEYMKAVARSDYETAANIATSISAYPDEPYGSWMDRARVCRRRATCSVCIAPSAVICCGCSTPYCSHHANAERCAVCGGRWLGDASLEQYAALAQIEVTIAYASSNPGDLAKALDRARELGCTQQDIDRSSARGRRRRETERVRRLERAAR